MSGITPLYGIHHPDSATKVINLGPELEQMAADVEAALAAAEIPPVTPAPVMVAATPLARDQFWGVPGNEAERLALQNRGALTIRTDTRWIERYFATYNATSNPGGATPAGWYPVAGDMPEVNLLPAAPQQLPTTMQNITNWAPPGQGLSVSTAGTEFFTVAGGVVTCLRAGVYEMSSRLALNSAAGHAIAFYLLRNNSTAGGNVLTQETVLTHGAYGTMANLQVARVQLDAGDNVRVTSAAASIALTVFPGANGLHRSAGEFEVRYLGPAR